MGASEQNENGTWRYTVVEGDVGGIICDRFGREYWQLAKPKGHKSFNCYSMIYVGDLLVAHDLPPGPDFTPKKPGE